MPNLKKERKKEKSEERKTDKECATGGVLLLTERRQLVKEALHVLRIVL
jgi:hypothetical protein